MLRSRWRTDGIGGSAALALRLVPRLAAAWRLLLLATAAVPAALLPGRCTLSNRYLKTAIVLYTACSGNAP